MAEQRFFRSIVLGGAGLVGGATLAVICGACGTSPSPPDELPAPSCSPTVFFSSECGFQSVTTTCTGGPVSCNDAGAPTTCTFGSKTNQVTSDCTVTAVLGDGTTTTFDVLVSPSSLSGCNDAFAQQSTLTCGGNDASTDAADAEPE